MNLSVIDGAMAPLQGAGPQRLSGPRLRTAWQGLTDGPAGRLRAREAAQHLGVSEGELVASLVGERATRLRTDGAGHREGRAGPWAR